MGNMTNVQQPMPLLVLIAHLVFGNYDRVWERTTLEGVKTRAEHWKDDKQS